MPRPTMAVVPPALVKKNATTALTTRSGTMTTSPRNSTSDQAVRDTNSRMPMLTIAATKPAGPNGPAAVSCSSVNPEDIQRSHDRCDNSRSRHAQADAAQRRGSPTEEHHADEQRDDENDSAGGGQRHPIFLDDVVRRE